MPLKKLKFCGSVEFSQAAISAEHGNRARDVDTGQRSRLRMRRCQAADLEKKLFLAGRAMDT